MAQLGAPGGIDPNAPGMGGGLGVGIQGTVNNQPATVPGGSPSGGQAPTPGLLGEGMAQVPNYNINQGSFNNPGYQPGAYQNEANNYLGNTTQNVTAQTAAAGNYGNYNTGTAGQLGAAARFDQMAAGNGPSQAQVTANQQGAANLAASESMLGSARGGGNPAATQLAARNAQTQGAQQVAGNAVAGRTAEELGAMNASAGIYGNIAGQGLQQVGMQQNNNQFNAGQQNQVAMGNQANTLAANTNYLGSTGNMALAQQQGQIAGQQLGVQQQLGVGQLNAQNYQNAAKNNQGIVGSIAGGISGALSGLHL